MAYASTTTRRETLTRDNYDTWCIQAEALLIKNDTWGYISGEITKPVEAGEGTELARSQATIKAWMTNGPKRLIEIKTRLSSEYQVKDLGNIKHCLGIEVEQKKNPISVVQSGYIREVLQKFEMSDCKAVKSPLAAGTKLERETNAERNDSRYTLTASSLGP